MSKFNIGDIVTGAEKYTWASESEYKIKEIIRRDNNSVEYILEKIKESDYCNSVRWKEDQLKFVDEDKNNCNIELTFRDVITKIKEDEVWESECREIKLNNREGVLINNKNGTKSDCYLFPPNEMFKLKRKKYTFEEAFKAYEEGKEIESCVNGEIYNKLKEDKGVDKLFNASQIRGKWYINNK